MINGEILSLLCAKSVRMDTVPGGIPKITPQDVAAMFRHCEPEEEALLRGKYCDEKGFQHHAWAYWFDMVMQEGWEQGRLEKLACATMDEHMSGLVCRTCGGIGRVLEDQKLVDCLPCGALGRRHWSDREMLRQLGFSKKSMFEPWKTRVAWCRDELRRWEARAWGNVAF